MSDYKFRHAQLRGCLYEQRMEYPNYRANGKGTILLIPIDLLRYYDKQTLYIVCIHNDTHDTPKWKAFECLVVFILFTLNKLNIYVQCKILASNINIYCKHR